MDTLSLSSVESGESDSRRPSDADSTAFGEESGGGGSQNHTKSKKSRGGSKTKEELVSKLNEEPADCSLPQSFDVKYLGWQEAAGIWGIRYTRKPVDALVFKARQPGANLSSLTLTITEEGIRVSPTLAAHQRGLKVQSGLFPIQSVSYGVQDLVYTRVFAMITVRDTNNILEHHPFRCHAYVCESRQMARNLTFTLATAFKHFSNSVKAKEIQNKPKKFAIDLRSPEEMKASEEADDDASTATPEVDDSEA